MSAVKSYFTPLVLSLIILVGTLGTVPVKTVSDAKPTVNILTPAYPVGTDADESRRIPYRLTESANVSGELTSYTDRFHTQYDVPLSESIGPYPASIRVNRSESANWEQLVYLPASVVGKARSMKEYAIVLKTIFSGRSSLGTSFSGESSVLLLLPPAAFSKASPANGAFVPVGNQSLHWDGSVGAIDYEYCFDTVDNNSCDTDWTDTYWLGTYDTSATLRHLPPNTNFYWQVPQTMLPARPMLMTETGGLSELS
jgi:hypothetical protein